MGCLPMTFILSLPFGSTTVSHFLMGNVLTGPSLHAMADSKHSSAWCLLAMELLLLLPALRLAGAGLTGKRKGCSKVLQSSLAGGDRERMTANHETYLLMASTQNDMEDWVKSIRRVIWAPFGGGESVSEHARLPAAQSM